jgi:hypothetical protein
MQSIQIHYQLSNLIITRKISLFFVNLGRFQNVSRKRIQHIFT